MNQFEPYKRLIKLGFALILIALLTGLYGAIWINWYNKIIWAPFFRRGNWMMIFIYGLLLIFFMQLYGGFKIALLKRGNLIYSQILAVVVTNIITYFQISVQDKKFTAPLPLAVNLVGAVIIILAWTMTFLWLYRGMFPPRELLLISGDHSDYHLIEKMNAREDKYIISQIISYHEGPERVKAEIAKYDSVIVGDIPAHERNYIIKYCFGQNIRTYSVPKISDILLRSSVELNLFDSPLLLSRNNQGLQIEQAIMKRIIDIIGSLVGIVITIPIFLIVGISIKVTDGGPVIYQQTRLTKNGKKFQIYKFRTMVQNAEADGKARLASEDDPRILPIGRLLRATRLDELPQIYNILEGQMSVIGPRPALYNQYDLIEARDKVRANDIRPGLTGLAQVNGRDELPIDVKARYDGEYAAHVTFWNDVKIFFRSITYVFQRRGVVEGGTGTMQQAENSQKKQK